MKVLAFAVVLLFGSSAFAQNCPYGDPKPCPDGCCGGGGGPPPPGSPGGDPPPGPPGGGSNNNSGPKQKAGLSGEPVLMETRSSFEASRDFTLHTSLGPVTFTRFFVSDAKQWWYWSLFANQALERVPKPFGAALPQATNGPLGLHWWHNFFSLVHPRNDTQDGYEIWVRDTDGSQSEFLSTATTGNWCSLATASKGASPSTRDRLKRIGSGAYEFFKEDGTALVFDQLFTDGATGLKYYFLGKKRAANGRTLFDVVYGTPLDSNGNAIMSGGTPCTDAPNGSGVARAS